MQMTFSLILVCFAVHVAGDVYPSTKLTGMVGFAKKGGTTGGSKGKVVFVKSVADLKKYISDGVPQTLVITANINSPRKVTIFLGSNKSLIGSWKANVINNVYFHTQRNATNIIFQNVVFQHSPQNTGNNDTQLILEFGGRYWIDHCTFDGGKVNIKDSGKLLKVSSVLSVTISYCKFAHHNYGLLLGFPSDNPSGISKNKDLPQVTIMFSFFDDINARAPGLMRYGKFHVFNNYIHKCRLGFTIGFQSKIYSEYNYFSEPIKHSLVLDDKGDGSFKDIGSLLVPKTYKSKLDAWLPSTEYHYKVQSADYSRNFCERYSGAQTRKLAFAPGN